MSDTHLSAKAILAAPLAKQRLNWALDIDGTGKHEITTGVPFFDHMLTQIAVHGLFDLKLHAQGDLEIDPHHTIEDTGLALGQAFREALGDRRRYRPDGLCLLPDGRIPGTRRLSTSLVVPYTVVQAEWNAPYIGGVPVTLFPHFLESFALEARCNLARPHSLWPRRPPPG